MRDGGTANSDLIDKFCRDKPNPVQTWGNALYMRYYSNQQSPNIGFRANVKIGRIFTYVGIRSVHSERGKSFLQPFLH